MKKTWKTINNVIGKGQKQSLRHKFKDECGSILTDPQDISNKFNDFFVNIGPKLASDIHNTGKNYYDYLKDVAPSSMYLRPIVERDVIKIIDKLDDSRTSMPALARPCTSGVETSKHTQVTCWHCECWDYYECVDNQYLSLYRTGGKWLPWFLRKSRPFIFKYRPLGPTYFNIWGKFTIVDV